MINMAILLNQKERERLLKYNYQLLRKVTRLILDKTRQPMPVESLSIGKETTAKVAHVHRMQFAG